MNGTTTAWRDLEFDAGHRLQRHESKCRNVHGHRYKARIEVQAAQLDSVGRVIDFGEIKRLVGTWIDDHWDHGFIGQDGDPLLAAIAAEGSKTFRMADAPTAEHMAYVLFDVAVELLAPAGIQVVAVTLWETPNCGAQYKG